MKLKDVSKSWKVKKLLQTAIALTLPAILVLPVFAAKDQRSILMPQKNPALQPTVSSAAYQNNEYKPADFTVTKTKRLAFSFQNVDVRSLLQLIAKESGLNFVISDVVKGNVTLNLKDVTWNEALKILMQTQGLASKKIGNVVYISTLDEITAKESQKLRAEEALANLSPLKSAIIHLKYTSGEDLAKILKGDQGSLLTPRGEVAVDSRTNTIIIKDTADSIKEAKKAVLKLDKPARQVLIEARIVSIDTRYEKQIGVRFGATKQNRLSGTFNGANQMVGGTTPSAITPATDRLNFNIPAENLFSSAIAPGSIALALAKIGDVFLDLELSALEGERHAQVISRPRVVTSNQQKAVIQKGEEIPYQESTSSGATSVTFKKAVLSLEITPQITPNNKIMLKLLATQDTRGANTSVGFGLTVPAIDTQKVESNILLNNLETVVVGGIYKVTKDNDLDRIPFFGDLPGIGYLFRHTGERNRKEELLIFITPKIITQQPFKAKPVMAKSKSGRLFNMKEELKR